MLAYLLDAFSGPGAVFMWAITALLAFGLAVLVERCWVLFRQNGRGRATVAAAIARRAFREAAQTAGNAHLGRVLQAGLEAGGAEAAWDAMGAAAAEAEEGLQGRIPYLATVGNIATMLGLLGTVYGLILAFGALGDTSSGERAVRLTQGISTAMATTAWGLLVGIPALAVHAWLDARARALLAAIEAAAGRLGASLRSPRG
ncbi:MAG: MotA/TolQ/ExbB proton channel family protein [Pseudomonadota bacterium]